MAVAIFQAPMTDTRFDSFCHRLCEALGLPMPERAGEDDALPALTLTIEGIEVGLVQASKADDEHAILLAEFGPLPEQEPLQACLVLLDTNFIMMSRQPPVFSRHPLNGSIFLHHGFRLADADPQAFEAQAREVVGAIQRWRAGEFLPADPAGARPPAAMVMASAGGPA